MTRPAVLVLSRWTGYCLPCNASDRPLVLVWTGPVDLRTRLLGPPPGSGTLRLTCGLCGGTDVVGWEDEHVDEALLRDDPVAPVTDALPVTAAAQVAVPEAVELEAVELDVVEPPVAVADDAGEVVLSGDTRTPVADPGLDLLAELIGDDVPDAPAWEPPLAAEVDQPDDTAVLGLGASWESQVEPTGTAVWEAPEGFAQEPAAEAAWEPVAEDAPLWQPALEEDSAAVTGEQVDAGVPLWQPVVELAGEEPLGWESGADVAVAPPAWEPVPEAVAVEPLAWEPPVPLWESAGAVEPVAVEPVAVEPVAYEPAVEPVALETPGALAVEPAALWEPVALQEPAEPAALWEPIALQEPVGAPALWEPADVPALAPEVDAAPVMSVEPEPAWTPTLSADVAAALAELAGPAALPSPRAADDLPAGLVDHG